MAKFMLFSGGEFLYELQASNGESALGIAQDRFTEARRKFFKAHSKEAKFDLLPPDRAEIVDNLPGGKELRPWKDDLKSKQVAERQAELDALRAQKEDDTVTDATQTEVGV